jgi:hypothetical protein
MSVSDVVQSCNARPLALRDDLSDPEGLGRGRRWLTGAAGFLSAVAAARNLGSVHPHRHHKYRVAAPNATGFSSGMPVKNRTAPRAASSCT